MVPRLGVEPARCLTALCHHPLTGVGPPWDHSKWMAPGCCHSALTLPCGPFTHPPASFMSAEMTTRPSCATRSAARSHVSSAARSHLAQQAQHSAAKHGSAGRDGPPAVAAPGAYLEGYPLAGSLLGPQRAGAGWVLPGGRLPQCLGYCLPRAMLSLSLSLCFGKRQGGLPAMCLCCRSPWQYGTGMEASHPQTKHLLLCIPHPAEKRLPRGIQPQTQPPHNNTHHHTGMTSPCSSSHPLRSRHPLTHLMSASSTAPLTSGSRLTVPRARWPNSRLCCVLGHAMPALTAVAHPYKLA